MLLRAQERYLYMGDTVIRGAGYTGLFILTIHRSHSRTVDVQVSASLKSSLSISCCPINNLNRTSTCLNVVRFTSVEMKDCISPAKEYAYFNSFHESEVICI